MASRVFLFSVLIAIGFLPIYYSDKSTDQTGLYFVAQPTDVIAVKGEPLLLPCIPRSVRNREVGLVWIHNNQAIRGDSEKTIRADGSLSFSKFLHKKDVYSDEGEYRCMISDGNGTLSSTSAYVKVAVLRKFTEHPKSHNVTEGSHVRMSCHVDSVPDSKIIWEHNDYVLHQRHLKHVILSGAGVNGSILYIFNVDSEDAGKYRCIAKNPAVHNQRFSKGAMLTVRAKDKQETPIFLTSSHEKLVRIGDTVPMDCVVSASPFPVLSWAFYKKGFNNASQTFNSTTTGYNIIYLKNITHHHSGIYVCSFMADSRKEIRIDLKVMTHPEFTETPTNVIYPAAKSVRLRCNVVGYPMPMIFWMKDGMPLNIAGRITHTVKINASADAITSEVLVASSVADDAGIYQCFARNPLGTISSASRLILNATKPAPKPPVKVTCQTMSSTQIRVDWDIHPEMLISGLKAFTVHYQDTDDGKEFREPVLPTNRSIIVHSLMPYTNYSFNLRSYSESASDFSEQVICQTAEEVPSQVVDITYKIENKTTICVSWSKPEKSNGIIRNYTLFYTNDSSLPLSSWISEVVSADTYEIYLTKLIPNVEYSMIIRASTNAGLGPHGKLKKIFIPVINKNASKKTISTDQNGRDEHFIGITVGLGIGLLCIIICSLCIICRRHCTKNEVVEVDRTSVREASSAGYRSERGIEESQGFECFPYYENSKRTDDTSIEQNLDNKGHCQNGVPVGVRITFLGDRKRCKNTSTRRNIRITENPRISGPQSSTSIHETSSKGVPLNESSNVEALNDSMVPLLSGKRKFLNLKKSHSEDSPFERDGKTSKTICMNFVPEDSKTSDDSDVCKETKFVTEDKIPVYEDNYRKTNVYLKENETLENEKLDCDNCPVQRNSFFTHQKLYNSATNS